MGKYELKQPKNSIQSDKTKKIEKFSKINSQDNVFSFRNIATNQEEVSVQFPMMQVRKPKTLLGLPKFRNDNLFYTPSFALANQFLTKLSLKQEKELFKFRASLDNQEDENSFILFPTPENRTGNCMICREKFQNYREHIILESHIDKIKCSLYNFRINQLCIKYKLERFFKGAEDFQQTKNQQTNENDILKFNISLDKIQPERKQKHPLQAKQALYLSLKKETKTLCQNKITVRQINSLSLNNIFDVLQF